MFMEALLIKECYVKSDICLHLTRNYFQNGGHCAKLSSALSHNLGLFELDKMQDLRTKVDQ